jgi:predicted SnoaL-like aldol condensation-catalyzing enzyme
MQRFMLHTRVLAGCATLALALSAQSAQAQEKLDKNAQFCEDFDQNVIIGGKLDQASKYLTDDFKEHNVRLTANGLQDFMAKMQAFRSAQAARAGGAGRQGGGGRGAAPQAARTVFSHDDVVIFMRPNPDRDDPNNPGQKIPGGTHFDVYKLRGGKIAEHWD